MTTPLTAHAASALTGGHPGARRQVDLPPRADVRRPGGRRDRRHPGCWKARTCCAPRRRCGCSAAAVERTGEGAWTVAGRGVGGLVEPEDVIGHGQLRHRRAAAVRAAGDSSDDQRDDRRRQLTQASDGPGDRAAEPDGRPVLDPRGRPPADGGQGDARSAADPLRAADGLGPRSSRRSCWPGSTRRARPTVRRAQGDPRPHRAHADRLRRRAAGRGRRHRRTDRHPDRPARVDPAARWWCPAILPRRPSRWSPR